MKKLALFQTGYPEVKPHEKTLRNPIMPRKEFKEAIQESLPDIDEILAYQQVGLPARPFQASLMFVSECIVDIRGDTKEDFFKKPWFKEIYSVIDAWYLDRYGVAIKNGDHHSLSGVVMVHYTPFELAFPITIRRTEISGETIWLTFPNEVSDEENVHNFFVSPPNIQNQEHNELEVLNSDIKRIVKLTRSIGINIMSADKLDKQTSIMAASINGHINKTVRDILSMKPAGLPVSFWELHLAVEKSFKVYIRQCRKQHPNTHELLDLYDICKKNGLTVDESLLAKLPPSREAIKSRYGEGATRSVIEAINCYNAMLDIVFDGTKALKRKLTFNNASFLIRKGPWV